MYQQLQPRGSRFLLDKLSVVFTRDDWSVAESHWDWPGSGCGPWPAPDLWALVCGKGIVEVWEAAIRYSRRQNFLQDVVSIWIFRKR